MHKGDYPGDEGPWRNWEWKTMQRNADDYAALPYRVEITAIAQEEGGGYLARLPQFGRLGIVGDGETPEEALRELEATKRERFAEYLAEERAIPEPET